MVELYIYQHSLQVGLYLGAGVTYTPSGGLTVISGSGGRRREGDRGGDIGDHTSIGSCGDDRAVPGKKRGRRRVWRGLARDSRKSQ